MHKFISAGPWLVDTEFLEIEVAEQASLRVGHVWGPGRWREGEGGRKVSLFMRVQVERSYLENKLDTAERGTESVA